MRQEPLFKIENPLKKRFDKNFFKGLPQSSGVYFLNSRYGETLYVGKSKNLKKRISSYRYVTPERASRRLCRLVDNVFSIKWQICQNETEALLEENKWIAEIKPKYNRANVAVEHYFYLHAYQLTPKDHYFLFSKETSFWKRPNYTLGAFRNRKQICEKLLCSLRLADFLIENRIEYQIPYHLRVNSPEVFFHTKSISESLSLMQFLKGDSDLFLQNCEERIENSDLQCPFTSFQLRSDLEVAKEFFKKTLSRNREMRRKISGEYIPKSLLNDLKVLVRPFHTGP